MRKYHSVRKSGSGRRRHMRGAGLLDWMKRAGSFIKSNKLVSRGLNALSGVVGPQYSGLAKTASGVASSLGYGRRRVRGGALSLAGVVWAVLCVNLDCVETLINQTPSPSLKTLSSPLKKHVNLRDVNRRITQILSSYSFFFLCHFRLCFLCCFPISI